MLYCNCHYRYKDQICELIGYVSEHHSEESKVKIRLWNDSVIICLDKDLKEIPLTETILQSCYRMKTVLRNSEWDVLWDLGGKNKITIGEKKGQFYLVPFQKIETVIEVLPNGLVQGQNNIGLTRPCQLSHLSDLERIFLDVRETMKKQRVRF